jgi:hypothetical protein
MCNDNIDLIKDLIETSKERIKLLYLERYFHL